MVAFAVVTGAPGWSRCFGPLVGHKAIIEQYRFIDWCWSHGDCRSRRAAWRTGDNRCCGGRDVFGDGGTGGIGCGGTRLLPVTHEPHDGDQYQHNGHNTNSEPTRAAEALVGHCELAGVDGLLSRSQQCGNITIKRIKLLQSPQDADGLDKSPRINIGFGSIVEFGLMVTWCQWSRGHGLRWSDGGATSHIHVVVFA